MTDLIHWINKYFVSVYHALAIALSALDDQVHLFPQQVCETDSILTPPILQMRKVKRITIKLKLSPKCPQTVKGRDRIRTQLWL